MTVYVITGGEYSDYHIGGVEVDKEKAERLCAEFNSFWFNDRDIGVNDIHLYSNSLYRIEEYDTDDDQMEMQNEVKRIFGMRDSGDFVRGYLVSVDINQCSVKQHGGFKYIEIIATLPKDISDEKAKKIMYDRIAKFKAERAGVIL